MSKYVLQINKQQFLDCAVAREQVAKICFRGGDLVHQLEIRKAMAAATKCEELANELP